jgi:parallel beta-helix repeat protein
MPYVNLKDLLNNNSIYGNRGGIDLADQSYY